MSKVKCQWRVSFLDGTEILIEGEYLSDSMYSARVFVHENKIARSYLGDAETLRRNVVVNVTLLKEELQHDE